VVKGSVPLRERGLVGPHAAPDNSRSSEEGTVKEQLKSFQGWNFLKLHAHGTLEWACLQKPYCIEVFSSSRLQRGLQHLWPEEQKQGFGKGAGPFLQTAGC
jgi:hypothetical protein